MGLYLAGGRLRSHAAGRVLRWMHRAAHPKCSLEHLPCKRRLRSAARVRSKGGGRDKSCCWVAVGKIRETGCVLGLCGQPPSFTGSRTVMGQSSLSRLAQHRAWGELGASPGIVSACFKAAVGVCERAELQGCFPCTDADRAAGLEPLGTLPLSQEHHSSLFSALFRQILPAQRPWLRNPLCRAAGGWFKRPAEGFNPPVT